MGEIPFGGRLRITVGDRFGKKVRWAIGALKAIRRAANFHSDPKRMENGKE